MKIIKLTAENVKRLRAVSDAQADIDDAWFRVVAAAGRADIDEPSLREAFVRSQGHGVETATVAELEAFLVEVQAA